MAKTVCMIPARGNSKRIPGKNIKDFCGKPIITYPIEIAKQSGIFDDIYVYTDSEEIASIAFTCNVNVMDRPKASDNETLTETIMNFINKEWLKYNCMNIDYLCILLPTAVFVEVDHNHFINMPKEALRRLEQGLNNAVITFCKYSHPIEIAFKRTQDIIERFEMIDRKYEFTRTQDLEESYYDAGQMYFLNVKSFLQQKKIFMDNIWSMDVDAVDIDNPEDWGKAEAYYKYKHGMI
jgi:pseudaminic acid cytidylyltransferase